MKFIPYLFCIFATFKEQKKANYRTHTYIPILEFQIRMYLLHITQILIRMNHGI